MTVPQPELSRSPVEPTPGRLGPGPGWWPVTVLLALVAAGVVAAGVWAQLPGGRHQARAVIELHPPNLALHARPADDTEALQRKAQFILRTQNLMSRTLADPRVAGLGTVRAAEDPARLLVDRLSVESAAPGILVVSLTGDHPDDLIAIVDTHISKYIDDATASERTARDSDVRKLERLAEEFKREIQAREKAIRVLAEANGDTGAGLPQRQELLATLEAEILAAEKDLLEREGEIEVLRKQIASGLVRPDEQSVAQRVDTEYRVAPLIKERTEAQAALGRNKQLATKPEAAPIRDLQTKIDRLDREIAAQRKVVRAAVEEELKEAGRRQAEAKLAELEDRVEATRRVLDSRRNHREELRKAAAAAARGTIDITLLLKELDPQREYLNTIEAQLIQLRIAKHLEPTIRIREAATATYDSNARQKILTATGGGLAALLIVLVLSGLTRQVAGMVRTRTGPAGPTQAGL
jgi:hypothetical protein